VGPRPSRDKLNRQTSLHREKAAALRKMEADRFMEEEAGEK